MSQYKKTKKSKKKLQYGGYEDPQMQQVSPGGTALSMGLKGAAAGSAFGPIGTAVGGLAGAAYGLVKGKQMKKEAQELFDEQMQQKQVFAQQNLISNAQLPVAMKHGGNLVSKKLKVLNGGSLNPISKDAVEVNASNPNQTDSVELQEAYVDNNEIIDRKNRVFSDEITLPNGKTIAKEAKRLEKMKSTSSRFTDSNSRIDLQLDNLFNQQESIKKPELGINAMRAKLASEELGKDKGFYNETYEMLDAQKVRKGLKEAGLGMTTKSGMNKGGKIKLYKPGYVEGTPNLFSHSLNPLTTEDGFAGITQPGGSKFGQFLTNTNWGKVANTAATVAPNITNAFLQGKLKGPAKPKGPTFENDVKFSRIDPSAELAEAKRSANMASATISKNTAQGSNLTSSLGSILAKRLAANNQIYGQNQAINAQIQNQEATINQFTRARNVERVNKFRDQQTDFVNDQNSFKNRKLMMTSENVANLSGKIQSQNRERNLLDRDLTALGVIKQQYKDSGVYDRNLEGQIEEYLQKKGYKPKESKGGIIKRNKNLRSRAC